MLKRFGCVPRYGFLALFTFILHAPDSGAQPHPRQGQSAAEQKAGGKTKKWPVKVLRGGSQQIRMTLEISQSTVVLKQKNGPGQEIPISKVTGVSYDNLSHRKSRGWLRAAGEIAQTPLALGIYPVAAPLTVAAFVAPFKTRTHFVNIYWNDGESNSTQVVLEIGKKHYAGVLAELQSVTEKPWLNLPEERKKRPSASPDFDTTNLPSDQTR